jgi:hypothetical protein
MGIARGTVTIKAIAPGTVTIAVGSNIAIRRIVRTSILGGSEQMYGYASLA